MSFQVANYFQNLGYRRGDVIGLAMQNRPEVICIWLGLSRVSLGTLIKRIKAKLGKVHFTNW